MSSMPRACLLLLLALGALACSRSAEEDAALVRTNRLSIFATENANIAPGAVVFLGGSTVERWDLAASFATIAVISGGAKPDMRCVNRGIANETLAQLVERAANSLPAQPATVVVHAGAFDLFALQRSGAEVGAALAAVLRSVRNHCPQARLLLLAPLPGTDVSDKALEQWRNAVAALAINTRTAQSLVALRVEVRLPMDLLDVTGRLRSEFAADAQHPNAAGYAALVAAIGPLP